MGDFMKLLILMALVFLSSTSFAQDRCENLDRMEQAVERLRDYCHGSGSRISKCTARGYAGLSPDEAIQACTSNTGWGRSGCIQDLVCDNARISKCKARGYFGLNQEEAIQACTSNTGWGRSGCIQDLSCDNARISKCGARGYFGLNQEEAIQNCVSNTGWGRSGCIQDLSCPNSR
jgi:hypothetical protein